MIVKSAGNEGDGRGHAEVQAFAGLVSISWDSDKQYRDRDYIEVWYDEWQDLEFVLVDPNGNRTSTVSDANAVVTGVLGGNFCTLTLQFPHPDCGHHLLQITIVPDAQTIQPGQWTLEIVGRSVGGPKPIVHAWVERGKRRAVRFVTGDSNAMTITVPGTAEHVITVSASGAKIPLHVPWVISFRPSVATIWSIRKIARVLGYTSHIALNTCINKRGLHQTVEV